VNSVSNSVAAIVCQGCGAALSRSFADLGLSPISNAFVPLHGGPARDPVYPLHARVCDSCLLVQVESVVPREKIFDGGYVYFSSFSDSWLAHCKAYAEKMITRWELGPESQVIEIASNDGYLLQYFLAHDVPSLGIEPSASVAAAARAKGVPTEIEFFGADTARNLAARGMQADLLAAKNVMAHVPDINDFVAGVALILKPEGVFTVEFPHLLNLIRDVQFDTIYHEHFTYLSLIAVEKVFTRRGLRVFDVEEVPTHGGSLRVYACRQGAAHLLRPAVAHVRDKEIAAGLSGPQGYDNFQTRVDAVRDALVAFLRQARQEGKMVAAYGAAAKGNTLLNYAGIGPDDIAFVVDRNPAKQDKLLPGSRIPVRTPEAIAAARPDYVLILPWNIKGEVMQQLAQIREWGGHFVTAIPMLTVE
jgi:SAM-dependent methyltransferase